MPEFDGTNNLFPNIANEYVVDKNTGQTVKVGDKGGNETDHVYFGTIENDSDGNVSTVRWSEDNATVLSVNIAPTPGPGNIFSQDTDPTPGHREIHARSPVVFDALAALFTGGGSKAANLGFASDGGKYTLSQLRKALEAAYKKLGVKSLAKGKKGKFGSPQRGDAKKGVRLDKEGHPKTTDPNENGPHINYWDYTKGKRGKGGDSGAIPID